MKNNIVKFVTGVIIVCLMVVGLDWIVGKTMDKVMPAISKQGQNGITYFSLNEVNTPVVIVGASTASHHYDTKILSDSLNCEVYNIGRDGCYFSYNSCVINSILDRYTPNLIIWETSLKSLENGNDPLESLYPYYGSNKNVTEYINNDKDWKEKISLRSNLYKYNSNILRIMLRYFSREAGSDDGLNGYLPLPPKEWQPSLSDNDGTVKERVVYEDKVNRFRNVLLHAKEKGTRIIVVESPKYMSSGDITQSVTITKNICDSLGVECYDFRKAEGIYDNLEYWVDYNHLNSNGAEVYTRMFINTCLK